MDRRKESQMRRKRQVGCGADARGRGGDRARHGRQRHRGRQALGSFRPLGCGDRRRDGGKRRRLRRDVLGAEGHAHAHALPRQPAAGEQDGHATSRWPRSGASTKTVNYTLALKCWKNNGCSTGTAASSPSPTSRASARTRTARCRRWSSSSRRSRIPSIGKIIYRSAHSDLNQAIADFKSMIAQHVSAIVTYPDFGDAMIPVFQQATKAGIPVSTYAWGYVTGPGTNYTTVVGEDTCKLGKAFAYVMNTQVKSGQHRLPRRLPRQPAVGRLADVRAEGAQLVDQGRRERSDELGSVEGPGHRLRHPREDPRPQGPELRGRAVHVAGRLRGVQGREHPLPGRLHATGPTRPAWAASPTS